MSTDGNGCTPLSGASLSEGYPAAPARQNHSAYGCMCNIAAFENDPDVCDLICSYIANEYTCGCINSNYAGHRCAERVCRLNELGLHYCQKGGPVPLPCDKFVNLNGRDNWPPCPCTEGGKLINDTCLCKPYYYGRFCEYYRESTTTIGIVNAENGSSLNTLTHAVAPIVVIIIASLCICRVACRTRLRWRSDTPEDAERAERATRSPNTQAGQPSTQVEHRPLATDETSQATTAHPPRYPYQLIPSAPPDDGMLPENQDGNPYANDALREPRRSEAGDPRVPLRYEGDPPPSYEEVMKSGPMPK